MKTFESEITSKEKGYIQNFTWKTLNFYGLPEIHKSQNIKDAIKEQNTEYIKLQLPPPPDLKMRPIVDGDIGTKMAPTYATPVMGYLEKEPYSKYEDTFGNKNKDDLAKLFKRFFDYCFIIWEGSEEDLMKFYYLLNDLYEKVKFTMEKDNKKTSISRHFTIQGRRKTTQGHFLQSNPHAPVFKL